MTGPSNDEDKLTMDGAWKKIPGCAYVTRGKDQKLYCTYKYDSERVILSKAISTHVTGLNENENDVVEECSMKFCPFKFRI